MLSRNVVASNKSNRQGPTPWGEGVLFCEGL